MFNKYLKAIFNGGAPAEPEKTPLEQGLALYEAGDHVSALPLLEEGLQTEPHHLSALTAMGRLLLDAGRADEAYQSLKVALALDGRNAQLHYMAAEALSALPDYVGAEAHFRKAVQHDADFTDAHIRLGMLLAETRRPQEAIKSFERAIFLDRTAVVARFHLATVCLELEDFQRALTQLHLVKELHPDYAPVYVLQGEIFQRLGDQRQAVVELSKAVELGAGDAEVHYRLGVAHLKLSNKEKAVRAFVQATEQDPEAWTAYYMAARLQEELKRYDQAYQSFQAIVEVEAYREEAQAALVRIGKLLSEIAASMAGGEGAEAGGAIEA